MSRFICGVVALLLLAPTSSFAKDLGPTFGAEVMGSPLKGLPFSWGADGSIAGREQLTADQNAILDQLIAAHDPTKIVIPDITKRQMLLWLLANKNKTEDDVLAAIGTIADPVQRAGAMIEWKYPDAGLLHRAHPLFDGLAATFGMTPQDITDAFVAASAL